MLLCLYCSALWATGSALYFYHCVIACPLFMIISSLYLWFAGTRIHRSTWQRMQETSPQAASAAPTSQCSPTLPLRPNSHSGTTTALQTFTPPVPKLPGHRYRAGTHRSTLVNRSACLLSVVARRDFAAESQRVLTVQTYQCWRARVWSLWGAAGFYLKYVLLVFGLSDSVRVFLQWFFSSLSGLSGDAALVKFMYLAFTCLPCGNHHRRFKSLVLCSCDVFQAVMNSLCLLFLEVFGFASPSLG